jgi:hypothetical protein
VSDAFGILPAGPPPGFDGGISCAGSIDANDPVALVEVPGTDPE